jgi:hypothetical protein
MKVRRPMTGMDWINAVFLLAVGLFLGLAVDAMSQLSALAFWSVALMSVALFGGMVVFSEALDRVIDAIFPSGIRPPRSPKPQGPRPLPLLLSLPAGVVLGMILGSLGLGATIRGLL